ncbi:MAG: hypothetical protein R3B83_09870 [Nitrospirales bacterium]|nr:hypothetical protein [Nitrospira sp.]MDR4487814.1 hypothetical protein [Nitrospirales bacterium]
MRGAVKNTIKILTIEDDSAQIEALKEALTVAQIICVEIHEAEDGEQAMAFLFQQYPFMDAPEPDLVFLSDNLPDRSAHEIVKELQGDRRLKQIPLAIFSDSPQTVVSKLKSPLPPNCHLFKQPQTCDEWIYVMRCIEDVWVTLLSISGTPKI